MVMASDAWPSNSCSSFRVPPRMTAQDAKVWRRVWKFTSSSFAALPLRPAWVDGVGQADWYDVAASQFLVLPPEFGLALLTVRPRAERRLDNTGPAGWRRGPQHPRALGVGGRSRSQQGERDEQSLMEGHWRALRERDFSRHCPSYLSHP